MSRLQFLPLSLLPVIAVGCSGGDDDNTNIPDDPDPVGAVYVMTNGDGQPAPGTIVSAPNSVVAFARFEDGTLEFLQTITTGGNGGDFDGDEGLDPLISANSVELTPDNTRLLAVNAGSRTVTSFRVNNDMTLTVAQQLDTGGFGPNSIATDGDFVFVTNIDADGVFNGEADQVGNVSSYTIDEDGNLTLVGTADLENRPSNVRMSTDGDHIIISGFNAGSNELLIDTITSNTGTPNDPNEVVVHPVDANGMIMARSGESFSSYRDININDDADFRGANEDGTNFMDPVTDASGNAADPATFRNLPASIGMYVAPSGTAGVDLVVVTETREFSAYGGPPAFPDLESGSVSTFLLDTSNGTIDRATPDFIFNAPGDAQQLTTCWIAATQNSDGSIVAYLANTINSLISSVLIQPNGDISLIESIAFEGDGPFPVDTDNTTLDSNNDPVTTGAQAFAVTDGYIDMAITADGRYLYQLAGLAGTIEAFERNTTDNTLTLIQTIDEEDANGNEGEIPTMNAQGCVAF